MTVRHLMTTLIGAGVLLSAAWAGSFKDDQQRYPRVRQARSNKTTVIDSLFDRAGVAYPPTEIFLRAFKAEQQLELWARAVADDSFTLIKSYEFTASSGHLGPKRAQGDLQIPEGAYIIDRFNPASNFHLSLGIDYPNASDRTRKRGNDAGGDIFIHGNRVTIGCIPLGDEAIKEVYVIAVDARSGGQEHIPVHIFPCRMDTPENTRMLARLSVEDDILKSFWDELLPVYEAFEAGRRLPAVTIRADGGYVVTAAD